MMKKNSKMREFLKLFLFKEFSKNIFRKARLLKKMPKNVQKLKNVQK